MDREAYTVGPPGLCALVARRRRRVEDALAARALVSRCRLHARGAPLRPTAERRDALGIQGVGDRLQGHPLGPHVRDPLLERRPIADRRPARAPHVARRLEALSGALLELPPLQATHRCEGTRPELPLLRAGVEVQVYDDEPRVALREPAEQSPEIGGR